MIALLRALGVGEGGGHAINRRIQAGVADVELLKGFVPN
jgi:hypothetical protein